MGEVYNISLAPHFTLCRLSKCTCIDEAYLSTLRHMTSPGYLSVVRQSARSFQFALIAGFTGEYGSSIPVPFVSLHGMTSRTLICLSDFIQSIVLLCHQTLYAFFLRDSRIYNSKPNPEIDHYFFMGQP